MAAATIDALNRLSRDEIATRLSGPREEVAAFIREAAEAGSAEAQARFGQMLLDGDGVPRDQAAGFAYFLRAARAGHLEAANMIGRCYDLGWGVAVDKAVAAAWYKRTAERGLVWAIYNYATLLALGHGVDQDRPQALDLFRRAAAAGNAKAMNFVGSFHEDGWVVASDMAEAAHWYRTAAEGGDFRGQFNHARMLIADDALDAALPWLAKAWAGGNPRFRDQVFAWIENQPGAVRTAAQSAIDSQ